MHVLGREEYLNKAEAGFWRIYQQLMLNRVNEGQGFHPWKKWGAMRNFYFTSNITPKGQRMAKWRRKFWCFLTPGSVRKSINIPVHVTGENSVPTQNFLIIRPKSITWGGKISQAVFISLYFAFSFFLKKSFLQTVIWVSLESVMIYKIK